MLRPVLRHQGLKALSRKKTVGTNVRFAFSTQSTDDAKKPTALAKLHLEDGTTLTATSFGCHESVEGEVSLIIFPRSQNFSKYVPLSCRVKNYF
jgi:hypothetical protein